MQLTQAQIDIHNERIGGSTAAVACGLSPRMTARELFHSMRGELPWPAVDEDLAMLGHAFEPVAPRWFEKETGIRFRPSSTTWENPAFPHAVVHLDGTAKGRLIGEYKRRGHTDGWGPSGTDEVPDDVILQCHHGMAVKGPKWRLSYVVALFHGVDFRWYAIPRDQGIVDDLMSQEAAFLERVRTTGEPPDFDYEHPSTIGLLQRLHPGTDGRVVYLEEAELHWAEVYNDAREKAYEYEKVADAAKAHLLREIGNGAIGMLPDGASFLRKRVERAAYEAKASSYMQFRYKRAPKQS